MRSVGTLAAALLVLLFAAPASADVALAGIFGDDMVLQRDEKIAIWGTADPGERVAVTFDDQTAKTRTGAAGRWRVTMGPFVVMAARTLTVRGKNTVTLKGVCVGEVWICSGQSNMQWPLRATDGGQEAVADSYSPRLRLFTVPRRVSGEPLPDVNGKWVVSSPATVPEFSAVAFHFAMRLREEMGIPVGLIHASWGGTPAESWTPREALDDGASKEPVLRPILDRWEKVLAAWPENKKAYDARFAAWKKRAEAARVAGEKPPRRPRPPFGPEHPHRAAGLWNAMIAPLVPFGARGVIWYQGESNAGRAEQYGVLFPRMIESWRGAFDRPDLRFYFVQLANFRARKEDPGESQWAELREAQRGTLRLPHTAMAVAIDIGDAKDIHPRNKAEVGRRLALAALALDYPEEFDDDSVPEYSGPVLEGHAFERVAGKGRAAVLRFGHAAGLRARGGAEPVGFAIAGADRKFRWARARIEGATVVCTHPDVPLPVAVRYGWADNPACNLENAAGLPASPFRTDDWPWLTAGKR